MASISMLSVPVQSAALPTVVMETPASMLNGASLTADCKSLDKGQDFVYCKTHRSGDSEDCDILAVFDGHAPHGPAEQDYMTHLKQAPLGDALIAQDPIVALVNHFATLHGKYNFHGGSTVSIARVYADRVECFNCGDSYTLVFLNGELAHVNRAHTSVNPEEMARLRDTLGNTFRLTGNNDPDGIWVTDVLSPTEITSRIQRRVHFPNGVILAPSQSLGHYECTGFAPDVGVVSYKPGDDLKVVVFSDGVGDMFSFCCAEDVAFLRASTAGEIVAEAERRWKQTWSYIPPNPATGFQPRAETWQDEREGILARVKPQPSPFPRYDDVCAACYYLPGAAR